MGWNLSAYYELCLDEMYVCHASTFSQPLARSPLLIHLHLFLPFLYFLQPSLFSLSLSTQSPPLIKLHALCYSSLPRTEVSLDMTLVVGTGKRMLKTK